MKKFLLLALVLVFQGVLVAGCGSNSIDQTFSSNFEVETHSNGRVVLKDTEQNTYQQRDFTPASSMQEVNIGPDEIKFGPKDNF